MRDYPVADKDVATVMNSHASPTKVTNRVARPIDSKANEDHKNSGGSTPAITFSRLVHKGGLFAHRDSISSKLPMQLSISESEQQIRFIDYSSTYQEININYHLMALQTSLLRPDAATYQPLLARALFLQALFRTNMVSLVILSCQYMTASFLCSLVIIEVVFIGALLFVGFTHKHMKSKILYVADMVQRLSLTIFLVIACLIHLELTSADKNKTVGDMAIVIIIIACASEYLGIFLYLTNLVARWAVKKYRAAKSAKMGVIGSEFSPEPQFRPARTYTNTDWVASEPKHPFLRYKETEIIAPLRQPQFNTPGKDGAMSVKHSRKSINDKQQAFTPKISRMSVFSAGQPSPLIVFNRIVKQQEKFSPAENLSTDRDLAGAHNYSGSKKPYNLKQDSSAGNLSESRTELRSSVYPRSRFASAHNMLLAGEDGGVSGTQRQDHVDTSHRQDTWVRDDTTTRHDSNKPTMDEGAPHRLEGTPHRLEGTPLMTGFGGSSNKFMEVPQGSTILIRRLPADKIKHKQPGEGRGSLLGKLKAAYNQTKHS